MKALVAFLMISIFIIGTAHGQFGICVEMCGPFGSVQCPAGYECRSNGCGHTCQKVAKQASAVCNPVLCEMFCVSGWQKDKNGCDICACRNALTITT